MASTFPPQVLVLDKGLVAEFGSPGDLLSKPTGIFTQMVNDTGEATAKFLKGVAAGNVSKSRFVVGVLFSTASSLSSRWTCPSR